MSADTALEVGRLYEQIKRIADAMTASQIDLFANLPGLRAYWPMGPRNSAGQAIDHSGTGLHANEIGVVPTGYDGDSYGWVGNGINYFGMSGAVQISGTETFIDTSIRGLTVGCWVQLTANPGGNRGIVSKYAAPPQAGWVVYVSSPRFVNFVVSVDGTATKGVVGEKLDVGTWYFVAARFTPSSEIAIFVDAQKSVLDVAIPASLFNSSQQLEIGRYLNTDVNVVSAKIRTVFLCAAALDDGLINQVRAISAP